MIKKLIKTIMYFYEIIIRDVTSLGGTPFYILTLLFTLVFGQMALFWELFVGMLFITLIIILIRLVYFRERPRKQKYSNIVEKLDASSFPSMHTARIFFLALVLLSFFGNKIFSVLLLSLALLVAYSRIYLRKHDFIDLLGGLILAGITYYLGAVLF
ncbi:MAG: phosphatase PAP2 family protein [Nanoarchaeota archaeon]|nr:phosphatase PAP2 family protein [Nanoarchaeota archaeon]